MRRPALFLHRRFRCPALLRASLFLAALIASAAAPAGNDTLPPQVQAALRDAGLPQDAHAFMVVPVEGDTPLLSVNAAIPMNPASVMKLVTTYAALDLLGPAHTWRTELLAPAPPQAGVLKGPLYLKGDGDPRLAAEHFWLLLRELRLRGVREIRGDLILDRSAYALPVHDAAAFDGEPLRPYNVGADPLLINFASVRFLLIADSARQQVRVLQETPDTRITLDNRLKLAGGECGDWRSRLAISAPGNRIELAGPYPGACGEKALSLAPLVPNAQVEGLFRAIWKELGGQFAASRRVRDGITPATAEIIVSRRSAALGELVRDINKFSNNVMARHVFLALAPDTPATYDAARQRMLAWIGSKGIDAAGFSVENGAGLSRTDRISARQLAALLVAAWHSPVMPELIASLPILGEDGTLRKHTGSNGRGRAHLKTGYLDGVRALAGYVLDSKGKRWAVVALINHPDATRGKPALDALIDWVARQPEAAANPADQATPAAGRN